MSDNGWISVDEQLPLPIIITTDGRKLSDVVLIYGPNILDYTGYLEWAEEKVSWRTSMTMTINGVAHWQPLPPPPEATP